MNFYRGPVIDRFRHVQADIFFGGMPDAPRLLDALRQSSICRGIEGNQALATRYEAAVLRLGRHPTLGRVPPGRESVEFVFEEIEVH